MKSIILLSLIVVLFSCRPETMLNKKLDGEWTLTTIDGQPILNDYSQSLKFNKKKAGGDATITTIENGNTETLTGTYSLLKSYNITIAIPNNSGSYPYDVEIYDIVKSTKTDMELKRQSDSKVFSYKK